VIRDGLELHVMLRHLTEREVARIGGDGGLELALVVEPLVFTLLARFEGVIPWSGGPYAWHSLPEAERRMPELGPGEEAVLTVVLVEATDAVVRAVRHGHVPGLRVVVPATPRDAAGLLRAAIRDDDPALFFEHKALYRRHREVVEDTEAIPLGVARRDRDGGDVSVITYGMGLHVAREAAEACAAEGISVGILDLRTVAPFDREAVAAAVRHTGKVVLVHEANRTMGPGAEVAAFIAEELFTELDAPILRVGGLDCHHSYNAPEEDAVLPDAGRVTEAIRRLARY